MSEEKEEYFSFKGLVLQGIAPDAFIYDGDTFALRFMFRGESTLWKCRMLGYDSPEIRAATSLSAEERTQQKTRAFAARDRLKELIGNNTPLTCYCDQFDKYGRILVTVFTPSLGTEYSVNQQMVQDGHVK